MRLLLFFILGAWSSSCFGQQKVILHCGQLFDSKSGQIKSNQSIVIKDNLIESLESGYIDDSNAKIINLKDQLVMPGWIDLHVHLEHQSSPSTYIDIFKTEPERYALQAFYYGRKTLLAGFTTVRDLGGTGANNALRDAINAGLVEGPRIYSVRKSIAITGGHADPTNGRTVKLQGDPTYKDGVCNGAEECAAAVRWQAKQGADWIKVTATGGVLSVAKDGDGPAFTDEELRAIVQTANDRGLQVAAHAHGKEGMLRAVNAGIATIEHGTYMDEEVMRAMKQKNCYYIPTITAGWAVGENSKKEGYYPDVVRPKAARIGPTIQDTFAKAYKFGVPIGFGTDAGVFDHGQNAKEFELMVEAGMPIEKALQAATIVNAKILKAENQLGQIAPGFFADIIAVDQQAIKNPELLQQVGFVMKNGIVYVNTK